MHKQVDFCLFSRLFFAAVWNFHLIKSLLSASEITESPQESFSSLFPNDLFLQVSSGFILRVIRVVFSF